MPQPYDHIIKQLDDVPWPITRREALRYRGVGPAVVEELAKRGLICEPPAELAMLPPRLIEALRNLGICSRAAFQKKFAQGKIDFRRLVGVGPRGTAMLRAWADGQPLDDGKRGVRLLLSPETREGLETLKGQRGLGSRDEVVGQLVTEALRRKPSKG
jgi:hypothetical protein